MHQRMASNEIVSFSVIVDGKEKLPWHAQLVDEGLTFPQNFEKITSGENVVPLKGPLPDSSSVVNVAVAVQKDPMPGST